MKRRLVAFVAATLAAGNLWAAADPALVALEVKLNLTQLQLDIALKELEIYAALLAQQEPLHVQVLADSNEATQREWESLLLECATAPGRCVIPQLLTANALNPECPELDEFPDQPEIFFYDCTLKEIYNTVRRDLEAAERQGLRRDFGAARQALDAARAAVAAGDGEQAFWSCCAAFKALACR